MALIIVDCSDDPKFDDLRKAIIAAAEAWDKAHPKVPFEPQD